MEKIYGAKERQDSLVKVGHCYYLYYGFGKDSDDAEHGYNYRHKFDHKPSAEEIREVVNQAIETETHNRIVNGLSYNGYKVTLSTENQMNYSMFKDVLAKSGGTIIIKMTDAEGNCKNVEFSKKTYDTFYSTVQEHIKTCLQDCWKEKGELDLYIYQS